MVLLRPQLQTFRYIRIYNLGIIFPELLLDILGYICVSGQH